MDQAKPIETKNSQCLVVLPKIENQILRSKTQKYASDDEGSFSLLYEKDIPKKLLFCKRKINNDNTPNNNVLNNNNTKPIDKIKSITTKFSICEVCNKSNFKYKCPACNIKTCCLECIKKHKLIKKCSGQKPTYNKIIESNKDLLKDVKYLTNMINKTNNASKTIYNNLYGKEEFADIDNQTQQSVCNSNNNNLSLQEKITTNTDTQKQFTQLDLNAFKDRKLKGLIKLAKKFRNVVYEKCPMYLSRFKENKSYCDNKTRKFYWTVKVYFLDLFDSMNKQEHIPSHLFDIPFDDSEFSLIDIFENLMNNKQKIRNPRILELLKIKDNNIEKNNNCDLKRSLNSDNTASVNNKEKSFGFENFESIGFKNVEFYNKINKIEYQNFLIFNNKAIKKGDCKGYNDINGKALS